MTAIDLRTNTMQLLEHFDYTDAELWQKIHDAIVAIYNDEKLALSARRAQQKAKMRQMVGILDYVDDDWKQSKEEALTEKYQ